MDKLEKAKKERTKVRLDSCCLPGASLHRLQLIPVSVLHQNHLYRPEPGPDNARRN